MCFKNHFESSFELVVLWTHKTIWCRLCSQFCISTLLRLLAILHIKESQDSVHFKLIMLIHSQSQSLKTCENSSEQFFCTSFPHGHPYSKVEGLPKHHEVCKSFQKGSKYSTATHHDFHSCMLPYFIIASYTLRHSNTAKTQKYFLTVPFQLKIKNIFSLN